MVPVSGRLRHGRVARDPAVHQRRRAPQVLERDRRLPGGSPVTVLDLGPLRRADVDTASARGGHAGVRGLARAGAAAADRPADHCTRGGRPDRRRALHLALVLSLHRLVHAAVARRAVRRVRQQQLADAGGGA